MYALCYTLLTNKQMLNNIESLNLSWTSNKDKEKDNNKNSKLVILWKPPLLALSTRLHAKKGQGNKQVTNI